MTCIVCSHSNKLEQSRPSEIGNIFQLCSYFFFVVFTKKKTKLRAFNDTNNEVGFKVRKKAEFLNSDRISKIRRKKRRNPL